jgi:carbonyl reductase 1
MTMEEVLNTNYFGPRRVNDTFGKLLKSSGGRIVNIASASGPNFVSKMSDREPMKEKLTKPWTITGGITELDSFAPNMKGDSYGASKALVNAYTGLHAKTDKNLIINSCSPGWIATDMTQGMGASNPPSKGAVVPCWLMMDEEVGKQPTGRYYGSDCVRSPLHFYRGPGEKPYVNDEDLV